MIHAPEHIQTIQPYVPGKPIEELERELGIGQSVKLASNESPLGPSPLALQALRDGMNDLNRYPDGSCFYLATALSEKLGLSPGELLFGNGSNEIIELAVRTFVRPGDEVITAAPSFIVYSMIVQAAGGKNVIVPLRDWRYDLDAMASRINENTKMIFIANPNNPTGTINTAAEMEAFMERVPEGVLVVTDEAYYEYVTSREYPKTIEYFRKGRDILILRTFSKIYGLAALRIGYGIAQQSILSDMNRIRQPFNVNSMAQRAARAVLHDKEYMKKAKRINEEGKKYLYRKLDALNISYIPSETNFVFILLKNESAEQYYDKLLHEGVIVRPMGRHELRVTVGLHRENERFIEALKTVMRNE